MINMGESIEEPIEYLMDKLVVENYKILQRRPDLRLNGDFTEDGIKLFDNECKIKNLAKLPVPLVTGACGCDNYRIPREDVIKYCAWCHREILDVPDDANKE